MDTILKEYKGRMKSYQVEPVLVISSLKNLGVESVTCTVTNIKAADYDIQAILGKIYFRDILKVISSKDLSLTARYIWQDNMLPSARKNLTIKFGELNFDLPLQWQQNLEEYMMDFTTERVFSSGLAPEKPIHKCLRTTQFSDLVTNENVSMDI